MQVILLSALVCWYWNHITYWYLHNSYVTSETACKVSVTSPCSTSLQISLDHFWRELWILEFPLLNPLTYNKKMGYLSSLAGKNEWAGSGDFVARAGLLYFNHISSWIPNSNKIASEAAWRESCF